MNSVMLSVILPVYNGEKYIKDMLQSIDDQKYEEYELLIINDGSMDSTVEICEQWSEKKENVKLINKCNGGTSSARNDGLKQAKGKYVIFLDQDDTIEPNMFQDLVEQMEAGNMDILISSKKFYVEKEKGKISVKEYTFEDKKITSQQEREQLLFNLERKNEISTIWNCIYRLDIIKEQQLKFSETLKHGGEDGLFNYEFVIKAENIMLTSKKYYNYNLRFGFSTVTKYNPSAIADKLYTYDIWRESSRGILDDKKLEQYIQYDKLRIIKNIYQHFSYHKKNKFYSRAKMLEKICNELQIKDEYPCVCTDSKLYDRYIKFIEKEIGNKRYFVMTVMFDIFKIVGK